MTTSEKESEIIKADVSNLSQSDHENHSSRIKTLIEEAETEINQFNYEAAQEKLREALKIDSNHIQSMEILAGTLIEQFEWEEAKQILLRCVELRPDTGYLKFFSMGQLVEGKESLSFFKRGIEILEKELDNAENIPPDEDTRMTMQRALSDAYCSVAELFMTDCCFEEDAEESCSDAICKATQWDSENPEAYQCQANFHLVKREIEDAKKAIIKSLSLWLPQSEAERDGRIADDGCESYLPSYDSRIKASKLLIELEMLEAAVVVLDGLNEDDEDVVETWYLLGWTYYLQGEKQTAYTTLNKAKKVAAKTGTGDEDQISHIEELIGELRGTCTLEEEDDEEQGQRESTDSEGKMDV